MKGKLYFSLSYSFVNLQFLWFLVHCMLRFVRTLNWQQRLTWLSLNKKNSVRGTQYRLDMNVNTKIPEQEFHKLWFYQIRIKFQGLCVHPFNFKILGLSAIFSAIIQSAVCQDFCCFCCWPTPEKIVEKKPLLRHGWDEWIFVCVYDHQSYHLKTCKYYRNIPKNAKSL